MQWCKDCDCNRKIIDFESIEFKIDGSRIDLQCVICNGLIGWWHTQNQKIRSQTWSEEEREEMR